MTGIRTIALASALALAAACGTPGDHRSTESDDRPAAEARAAAEPGPGAGTAADLDPSGIARPLPDVELTRLDGSTVALSDLIEGPTIVNFWATWCGPCRREMPELAELDRQRPDVMILGIAVDSGSPDEILAFAEQQAVEYPLFVASRNWANRHFELFGMPTTLVVDAEGNVRERLVGPQSREVLEAKLDGP